MTTNNTMTETTRTTARDAAKTLKAKWGKGWDLLAGETRRGLVAMTVLDVLTLDAPEGAVFAPAEIAKIRDAAMMETF